MTFFTSLNFLAILLIIIDAKSKNVSIKWITTGTLPEMQRHLSIGFSAPCNSSTICCAWYKLNENKTINYKNFGEQFQYKLTQDKRQLKCNLLMTQYASDKDIDIYTPSNSNNGNEYIALVFFRTMEIRKIKLNHTHYNYSCMIELDLPDTLNNKMLYKSLENALYSSIYFESDVSSSYNLASSHKHNRINFSLDLITFALTTIKFNTFNIKKYELYLEALTVNTTNKSNDKIYFCTAKFRDEINHDVFHDISIAAEISYAIKLTVKIKYFFIIFTILIFI